MKKLLIVLFFTPILTVAQSPTGTVTGVVTYFFNDYQGDKADIGSEVFAIQDSMAMDFSKSLFDTLHYATSYRNMASGYPKKKIPESIKGRLIAYRAEDEAFLKQIDKTIANSIAQIEASGSTIKTSVDGSGSFLLRVAPGNYYVFIRSNARKGNSITEIMGKIYCERIIVSPKSSVSVSRKFDQY